ncbi:MAG: glycosyl transferase family 2 [Actinobacteria bacterium]|nr:glycosyl transferase family 2 [Actinomycetota bacterium]
MTDKTVLHPQVLSRVERLGEADIIVGIPSFRNANTIAHVVRIAALGTVQYFPELKPVLVNSDGGSRDRTRETVLETPVPPQVEKIVTPYRGPAGKGSAFQTIFEIADRLHAKVCIVIDSDLRSITPEWIRFLGDPIYRYNYGFVAPHYLRYKYDGTITNSIAYPITRALYGQRVRQPIGGDFGVCWALAKVFSQQNIWEDENVHKFGIDIWMTTMAINEGFRVCQSAMGVKLHDPKDPGADLGPMFREVVSTIFELMRRYEAKWKVVYGSRSTDTYGMTWEVEPEQFAVDLHRLIDNFKTGFAARRELLRQILADDTFGEIEALMLPPKDVFSFPRDLWVRAVYDFAVAYNWSGLNRREVVDALMPLYFGRVGSFVIETEVMNNLQAEEEVEETAEEYERLKSYLIERWEMKKSVPALLGNK